MKKAGIVISICLTLCGTAQAGWVPQVSGVGFTLRAVSFADSLNGIAGGDQDTLLRTPNGGTQWFKSIGPITEAVDMVTPRIGWAAGGGIYKTTNGGVTWVEQLFGYAMTGISFVDTLRGLAVGWSGIVLRTTNGGSMWVQETTNVKRDLFDVCMADSLHAWACGYDGGVDTFSIIVSRDGGQTWTRQRIPNGGTYDLHGISFSDTLHGLAVGGNSSIYRTDNGGALWAEVYPGIKEKADVVLVDSLWGWLVGSPYLPDGSLIQQTTDGGMTWITQTPGTNQRLFGVSFVDRRNGWAVGDNGTILHTSDGGAWVEEEPEGRRQKTEGRITIRPNPFTDFASIPDHAGERFALFDITGRLMGFYHGDRIGGDLKAGVYFIKPEGNDDKPIRIVKVR